MAVDPYTASMIASAVVPVVGGIMGNNAANDEADRLNKLREQALAQYAGIKPPSIEEMTLALEQYQLTGELTPELQQLIQLGDTNLGGVSTDPRLRSEQMSALEGMSQIASGNPQSGDLAGFELARQNSAGELNAQNNRVLQDMQQRGQAGSGAELMAKLKNNQSSAQMLANAQLEQAKAMQQARLQALQNQSSMATNLRGQDYSEAANLANARDAIAKYNAMNSQAVSNANAGVKNATNAANLQNKQNISNMNVGTQNQEQIHNKGLKQTDFGNQMNLAGAKAGIMTGQANANASRPGEIAAGVGGISKNISDIFTGIAGMNKKDEKKV